MFPERPMRPPAPSPETQFDEIYRDHVDRVARWAAHLGGPQVDAEDVVQEVFLVVRRRLPEFRGNGKLTTWLYRITERVAWEGRRKEQRRRWWTRHFRAEIEDALAPARPTPIEEIERRQLTGRVYAILDRLPEKYRSLLILFELEELEGETIAELTGLKPATVWVRLHRARARFVAEMKRAEKKGR